MATTPPPTWPIEPTTLYIVAYYPTNSTGEAPSFVATNLTSYPEAIQKAKDLITDAGNIGVCVVSNQTATIVYPAMPWVDF